MNVNVKITENDTNNVVKIILLDRKNKVLLLKRSNYLKKHAGEWDLPGGHLKPGETLDSGLIREVREETKIKIRRFLFFKKIENISFFWGKYNSQPVRLSHEHSDYKFSPEKDLDPGEKFQKIALELLEEVNRG